MRSILLLFLLSPFTVLVQNLYLTPLVGFQYIFEADKEITPLVNDSIIAHYPWAENQTDFDLDKGSIIGIGLGYPINSKLSFEFNFSLWRAHNVKEELAYAGFVVNKVKGGTVINFSPAFHYTFKEIAVGEVSPYIAAGLLFTTANLHYQQAYRDLTDTNALIKTAQIDYNYTKGLRIGASAEVGVHYQINNRLRFFGGIHTNIQQVSPLQGNLTNYVVNDVDLLGGELTSASSIAYVQEDDPKLVAISTINDPEYRKIQTYALNSLGLKIGLRFTLGMEKE